MDAQPTACRTKNLGEFRVVPDPQEIRRLPSIFFMLNLCHQPRFALDSDNIFFVPREKAITVFRAFLMPKAPKRIKYRFPTGSDPAPRLILSALQIELLLWPLVAPRLSIATQNPPSDIGNEDWLHSLVVSTLD